jgi:hypothetical protein
MWMASSSEKLVDSNPSTWHYSSENWNLHGVLFAGEYFLMVSFCFWPLAITVLRGYSLVQLLCVAYHFVPSIDTAEQPIQLPA